MKMLSILVCKIINRVSKLTGRGGSVIGGHYALKIDKNILKKINLPKYIIGVTGSSGKSSTVELANNIFTKNGYSSLYNKEGSNTINGITSLILNNSTLLGNVKKDVLLMELDEQYFKKISEYIKFTHIIVTNITRDQPPRNSHPYKIYNCIKDSLSDNPTLIINSDDPIVNRLSVNYKGKVIKYGLDKNNYSVKSNLNNLDAVYCPLCHSKPKYDFYHYGHIGSYKCPKCKFKRETDVLATDIDIKKKKIKINNNIINLTSDFLYTAYFTTAVYTLCKEIGVKEEDIVKSLNDKDLTTKRLEIYDFDNRKWQMLISKNENNLSYKQSLDYLSNIKKDKTLILGFDSSSRRYKENDISWLWDIDFEQLNNKYINKIVLIGKFAYDMLARMEYAGISKNKLIVVENLSELSATLKKNTKGDIYSMVCFDKEIELKKIIKEEA